MTGDIMQRMSDHNRIEAFLTNTTLNVLFSLVNLLVFGGVLLVYSVPIFTVFILGSGLYAAWVVIFLRQRKKLDYKRFQIASQNQNQIIQLVSGIHEIKLNDRKSRTGRAVDIGRNAGCSVHHWPAQLTHRTAYPADAGNAGCQTEPGSPE
jgi:ABC-type bacteriocin/lantibiotic exporter with double-glycine peptidase domain